ncbi:MAG: c-type cytochrome [Arcobacteraceae bacterium]
MINKKLLLSVAVLSLLYSGCTEEEPKEVVESAKKVEVKDKSAVTKVTNDVMKKVESTVEKTEELAKDIKTSAEPVVKEVVETVEKVQTKVTKAAAPVIESVKAVVATPDATKLYNKCAACHGLNAEKKALNNSQIIKDWEAAKIAEALKGYKNGTYGGAMKGLMVGQVANLSDAEIDALSEHISKFN